MALVVDVLLCAVYHEDTIDKAAPTLFSAKGKLCFCLTYPVIILRPYPGLKNKEVVL